MNVEKHRPTIKKLFAQFYANEINKETFIQKLYDVQKSLYESILDDNKELWFRFFKGDPMVTTLYDLRNDINCTTNHNYIMTKIRTALEKPKGLQIYYS